MDRRFVAFGLLTGSLFGCSGPTRLLTSDFERLTALQSETADETGAMTLRDCMERAGSRGPDVLRAGLRQLSVRLEEVDTLGGADPIVSAELAAGASLTNRAQIRPTLSIRWDLLQYLQRGKQLLALQRRRDTDQAMGELSRKEAALDAAQSYLTALLAQERSAIVARDIGRLRSEVAVLESAGALGPQGSSRLQALRSDLATHSTQQRGADAERMKARARLGFLARLPLDTEVPAEVTLPDPRTPDESLSDYVSLALRNSPALGQAELNVAASAGLVSVIRSNRWTRLSVDLVSDSALAAHRLPLVAPVRWIVDILDSGRQERRLLRVRIAAESASAELQQFTNLLAVAATGAWFEFAQRSADVTDQDADLRRAEFELAAARVIEPSTSDSRQAVDQRTAARIEALLEHRTRRAHLLLAHMQYELLRGTTFRAWLDAVLPPDAA